ncbi:MAG: hypothetical protein F4224_04145 [Nitrospira sp. SB0678_bin_10]|nr:hypothetical protein [Nitrospira sp. SB0678_bin_10]
MTASGPVTPWLLVAVPATVIVLFGAASALSTAVRVTEPVLVVDPAAMVRVRFVLNVKSLATAGATGVADTVIVVGSSDA